MVTNSERYQGEIIHVPCYSITPISTDIYSYNSGSRVLGTCEILRESRKQLEGMMAKRSHDIAARLDCLSFGNFLRYFSSNHFVIFEVSDDNEANHNFQRLVWKVKSSQFHAHSNKFELKNKYLLNQNRKLPRLLKNSPVLDQVGRILIYLICLIGF